MLARLLNEIEKAGRPLTTIELAARLGVSRSEVDTMMIVLRSAGRLAPETPAEPEGVECVASETCSLSCPGPASCSFVVDPGIIELGVRSVVQGGESAGATR